MQVCPQSKGNELRNVHSNSNQDLPQILRKLFYDHWSLLELYPVFIPCCPTKQIPHWYSAHYVDSQYKNK